MRKSRFTAPQIMDALRQAESGVAVPKLWPVPARRWLAWRQISTGARPPAP